MAEPRSILGSLWDWVGPKQAEAGILAQPQAAGEIQAIKAAPAQDYLPQLYQQVVRRAEEHPEQVGITPAPRGALRSWEVAAYAPATRAIVYAPQFAGDRGEFQDTLVHELVHFLATQGRKWPASSDEQHRLIQTFLGSQVAGPGQSREGYTPAQGGATVQDLETFAQWLAPAFQAYQTGRDAPMVAPR